MCVRHCTHSVTPQQGSDEPIPVTAERIGPPGEQMFRISELLEEIRGL